MCDSSETSQAIPALLHRAATADIIGIGPQTYALSKALIASPKGSVTNP
jgi:hypothetical protein